ncbi:molybdopterin molybdotransferase MoeA [Neisseria sp. Ec49-e6-T10]|uniref:molybdopterin molybdotransferase MoeA n=1 Tax=Neisseria sp. Ec49-e6-T10 TaxID=3140744 RepID=UPI003EBCD743
MLDYYQALDNLIDQLPHTDITQIPIEKAHGLLLAQDIYVQHNTPLFDNSAMDGYAICGEENKNWQIIDRIAAGDSAQKIELKNGQAVRIFTGAPLPKGATAVLAQEDTHQEETQLFCQTPTIKAGQNIRYCAEELSKGSVLLEAGQALVPAAIALAASQGYATLPIYSPLRITVFSSGNELLNPTQALSDGKIYDANRYLVLAWLQQLGFQVADGGILPDNQQSIALALKNASQNADVIITSGGVSVGEEDHLKAALLSIGELTLWKLAIKPGKPFAWGNIEQTKVFMLPGNPVATFVTFHQLVLPALRKISGYNRQQAYPQAIQAKALFDVQKTQNRRVFLRGILSIQNNEFCVEALPNQGSAMLSACVKANVLIDVPPEQLVKSGDTLTVYPLTDEVSSRWKQ